MNKYLFFRGDFQLGPVMASERPTRPRNPTAKASADINGDFSQLLPYQQRHATEAAARKTAEQSVPTTSTSQPPPNAFPAPSTSATDTENGADQHASVGMSPSPSTTSNKRPPSPTTISDDEEAGSLGGDETSGSERTQKKRQKKKKRATKKSRADLGESHILTVS